MGSGGRSQGPVAGWVTFGSVTLLMMVPGTIYAIGEWSDLLKGKEMGFDYSQTQVASLALMVNFGNYITLDAGVLTSRYGTVVTFCYGSLMVSAGYLMLWAGIVYGAGQTPFGVLAFFCLLYGHGCGSIDNAGVTELIHTFPDHKGNAMGCVKAFYGLASATVAVIYDAVFAPTKSSFLLFLGCYSAFIGCTFIPVVYKHSGVVQESAIRIQRKFRVLVWFLVGFAIYFCVVALVAKRLDAMPSRGKPVWLTILGTIILGAGSLFFLATPGGDSGQDAGKATPERSEEPSCLVADVVADREVSGFEMLTRLDFWVFIGVLVICQGSGLLLLNNAGQLFPAYEGRKDSTGATSFVAVISCFNSLGRLVFGNVSEALKGRVHRTVMLVVSAVLLAMSYTLLSVIGSSSVWLVGSLIGFGYGGLWGVQPVILCEIFGDQDYGVKYSCSAFAAFLGSLFFSTLLAGRLADREARLLGTSPDCLSPTCFQTAVLVTALSGILSTLLALLLWYRTKHIYVALSCERGRTRTVPPPDAKHVQLGRVFQAGR